MVKPRLKVFWLSKDDPTWHSQLKERELELDRRGCMTILKNGQEWTSPAQLGQLEIGQSGKRLLQSHLSCSNDLPRRNNRIDFKGLDSVTADRGLSYYKWAELYYSYCVTDKRL